MDLLVDQVDPMIASFRTDLATRTHGGDLEGQVARFSLLFNLCLWFHDSVYDPKSKDNELRSRDFFAEFAEAVALDDEDRNLVSWVIMDTIKHRPEHGPADLPLYKDLAHYFLDADLSILCAERAIYEDYSERIWREYSFVGREVYCSKRPAVL